MHLHNVNGIAIGAQRDGLLPLSAHALHFHEQLAYHDYEGLEMSDAEQASAGAPWVTSSHAAAESRHAGLWQDDRRGIHADGDAGQSPAAIQLKAQSGDGRLHMPSHETCLKTHQQLLGDGSPDGRLEWPALLRKLDKLSPNYPLLKGSTMPTINVQLFEGRTLEQKRAFVKAVTEATVQTLGASAESVDIIIHECKRENWATAGKLWSEQD
jgi:4-oxalocrotonate tautomerase family enzyme